MDKSIYSKKYNKVVERLKQARIDIGLTQTQVAQKLKKQQSYISKIERGERRIDIVELEQLANLYKRDVKFFIS